MEKRKLSEIAEEYKAAIAAEIEDGNYTFTAKEAEMDEYGFSSHPTISVDGTIRIGDMQEEKCTLLLNAESPDEMPLLSLHGRDETSIYDMAGWDMIVTGLAKKIYDSNKVALAALAKELEPKNAKKETLELIK